MLLLAPSVVYGIEIEGFRDYRLGASTKEIRKIAQKNNDELVLFPYNKEDNSVMGTLFLSNNEVNYVELKSPLVNFYDDKLYNLLFILESSKELKNYYNYTLKPIIDSLDMLYGKHEFYKGNMDSNNFLWKSVSNHNIIVLTVSRSIDNEISGAISITNLAIEDRKNKEHPNRHGW